MEKFDKKNIKDVILSTEGTKDDYSYVLSVVLTDGEIFDLAYTFHMKNYLFGVYIADAPLKKIIPIDEELYEILFSFVTNTNKVKKDMIYSLIDYSDRAITLPESISDIVFETGIYDNKTGEYLTYIDVMDDKQNSIRIYEHEGFERCSLLNKFDIERIEKKLKEKYTGIKDVETILSRIKKSCKTEVVSYNLNYQRNNLDLQKPNLPRHVVNDNEYENSEQKLESLLLDIEKLSNNDQTYGYDYISLYDVFKLAYCQARKKSEIQEYYESSFEYDTGLNIRINGFAFGTNELILDVLNKNIRIIKKDNNLYITNVRNNYYNNLLNYIASDVSKLYDSYSKIKSELFPYDSTEHIQVADTNFYVRFSLDTMYVQYKCCSSYQDLFKIQFERKSSLFRNKLEMKSQSLTADNIISYVMLDKECDFSKNAFVKIADLPEWAQDRMYELRKNELRKRLMKRRQYHL